MSGPGGITVIKIGGSTLEDVGRLGTLWRAIAEASSGSGGRSGRGLVLVHGGGKAVDSLLGRLGMPVERRDGLRVTPKDQIGIVAGVLRGEVNAMLVGAFNAAAAGAGVASRAVGLCLGDGGMVECRRASEALGCVGEVMEGEGGGGVLRVLLAAGYVPVVSSIGMGADGGLLNINADDAASGIARVLGATRLVLLTDVEGVRGADGAVVPTLTPASAGRLIEAGVVKGGMAVKVRSALSAAQKTGAKVVILSGEGPGPLAAYISGEKVGTEIVGHDDGPGGVA
ncbi:MAG: acetylglutamate kinase [Phycisphaeraceae bacterium]|nr:MAG: acetylglutamate kinase [Phycisphaeraceae bacterium]